MTVDSILETTTDTEVIVVNDGSLDDSCHFLQECQAYKGIKYLATPGLGTAQARNLGASQASGEIFVFCDCHMLFPPNWLAGMCSTMSIPAVGIAMPIIGLLQDPQHPGYAGMQVNKRLDAMWLPAGNNSPDPFEIPLTPSTCMVMKAEVFQRVGGFCELFKPYGHEDLELSLRTSLMGYNMLVNPQVKVLHLFRGWQRDRPYKIVLEEHRYNVLLMAYLHLSRARIKDVYQGIIHDLGIEKAMLIEKELFMTDVFRQRTILAKIRKRNDNWFFSKFPMYDSS
ncbi:glycosyltransferase family 2 protein [Desulforamulus ferrireducens]|uniref:Glycosyltransferase 2-like domain-containing protein n=1 Tax=Desulforamulus ferrireducens TaxID=1833852 RepID=A0A1S6ITY9_9FIRM|nr:glycosyltransferase [Desulforamulus ferrireducens]AQS58239.1 hypothetical protein B0537_03535 [Desulforamulus ferrireducens]